jgi:8-oxo-dGTP pyrophosphatase MutT (NUDIX family)
MKREVFEETGLRVITFTELYQYKSHIFYPHRTTVFHGHASGNPRKSWEGTPVWLELSQIEGRIFPPHQAVLSRLKEEVLSSPGERSQLDGSRTS